MGTLFFLLSLLIGWLAWNLYHPTFKSPRMAVLSFAAGLTMGELALHVIFWQVLTVGFFVLIGAVWGLFGAIGFLICAAGWAATLKFFYDGNTAKQTVADALASGLGADFESEIDPELAAAPDAAPEETLIRHPFRHSDPAVTLKRNIHYGDHGQRLDLRYASGGEKGKLRPVLLQIHGGAWMYGRKDDGQGVPLMNLMAKCGWICVAPGYRLSPSATFPDQIIDCKQALAWVKENIAEYGGDANFVAVTGGSAGGHLASLLALTPNDPAFQPGFETIDTSVQAAVPFYGVYDLLDDHGHYHHDGVTEMLEDKILKLDLDGNEDSYRQVSPLHQVNDKAPPMLIVHGAHDTLVPVEVGRAFADKMREISPNKVAYLELAGAQHAFDVFPSLRSEHVKFGVERFLSWSWCRHQKSL